LTVDKHDNPYSGESGSAGEAFTPGGTNWIKVQALPVLPCAGRAHQLLPRRRERNKDAPLETAWWSDKVDGVLGLSDQLIPEEGRAWKRSMIATGGDIGEYPHRGIIN
jgi:hypothetical protein